MPNWCASAVLENSAEGVGAPLGEQFCDFIQTACDLDVHPFNHVVGQGRFCQGGRIILADYPAMRGVSGGRWSYVTKCHV
jgi:hypothetical protein